MGGLPGWRLWAGAFAQGDYVVASMSNLSNDFDQDHHDLLW